MGVGIVAGAGVLPGYAGRRAEKKAAGTDFEQSVEQAKKVGRKEYIVYTKTDDMLYSGGNGSGLSFYIKYAKESTKEDPIVVAKGVDENGEEFEQTIHINQISPCHATLVEMRALEAYLDVDKNGGLSSLPLAPGLGNMGLHDRGDFMAMFQKTIADLSLLKQRQAVAYYQYSMQMYQDFLSPLHFSERYATFNAL